ncbi:hypothetical protein M0638_05580 [Roseomonas sp. NAR14]|uniref:Uncharacterized protein n=1 Tax=Roseomonas acroporae TaxID=2937791 RepID=A0A9X1Y6B4_9PROT|nr:hypothetical protein [Roseomonas acroporae]MCK8783850.1 hypothetical protein [Roseomonas acroporae]
MHQPVTSQPCPICGRAVAASPRYPRYLCRDCAGRACTADGRKLEFFNAAASGGYMARHADDGTDHPSHECYVDGRRCHADEARFGGIVIQPAD